MNPKYNLIGRRFGKLTVIKFSHSKGHRYWHCRCDCGNKSVCSSGDLNCGHSKTCGCGQREAARKICLSKITHGMTGKRLYYIWRTMKARCYNQKSISFPWYGAKGITVCDEWHDFIPFRDWALSHGYTDKLCIDRKKSKKNYCPENCRWITGSLNSKLAQSNFVTLFGKTQSMTDWAKEYKIGLSTVLYRINNGWKFEDALKVKPIYNKKSST